MTGFFSPVHLIQRYKDHFVDEFMRGLRLKVVWWSPNTQLGVSNPGISDTPMNKLEQVKPAAGWYFIDATAAVATCSIFL